MNRKSFILTLFSGAAWATICFGQPQYTVTQLASPTSLPNEVTWISDGGKTLFGGVWDQTVTNFFGIPMVQCYVTRDGVTTFYPTPGFSCQTSFGRMANSKGQFAGMLLPAQSFTATAFANLDGSFDVYGARLPGLDYVQDPLCAPHCAVPQSYSAGINERGDIVGSVWGYDHIVPPPGGRSNFIQYGYVYSQGQVTQLPLVSAIGINNNGDICGNLVIPDGSANPPTHAAVYSNGQVTDLGSLGGVSIAAAINSKGQVAGTSYLKFFDPTDPIGSTYAVAFFHDGKKMNAIQVPNAATGSSPVSLNDAGEVIGVYFPDSLHRGAFYYANGTAVDLNTLLVNAPDGLVLNWPLYISNSGQILAASLSAGGSLSGTYLLTPVASQSSTGGSRLKR
jgi:probable HAF family extracellular repeat protein